MNAKKTEKKNTLSQTEYEALANFRYTIRQFLKFSENAAADAGLTPNQHQALLVIKGFSGRNQNKITNGELAERLQIKHHSAVGLVNRLEAQKLVCREQGKNDRREVYVKLTKEGEKLLEQMSAAHREELKQLAPQLNEILESLKQDRQ